MESKNHGKKSRENFTPLDGKVLNNLNFSSKFTYNLCIEDYHTIKKISIETENNEQEKILTRIHKLKSSKVRLTNYKLIHNGLPTNEKFRNKYDYECFMCKRKITESLEHIFVDCEKTKKLYEYVRKDFLKNKQLNNSLDLLRLKRGVSDEDFGIVSYFVYIVWRVRNACKHGEVGDDPFVLSKILFNKWLNN